MNGIAAGACLCVDYAGASSGPCQWDNEELMLIERFFEAKVGNYLPCLDFVIGNQKSLLALGFDSTTCMLYCASDSTLFHFTNAFIAVPSIQSEEPSSAE